MIKLKHIVFLVLIISTITSCYKAGTQRNLEFPADKVMYTAFNLWYPKWDRMYAINYQKGNVLPAGTQVKNVKIRRGKQWVDGIQYVIIFTDVKTEQPYIIHFQPRFHNGLKIRDYLNKIFTDKNLAEQCVNFTTREKTAVQTAKLILGMRKEAVLVAWGYPPEHKTASLDKNEWKYWINRTAYRKLKFNSSGELTEIGPISSNAK